LRQQDAVPSLNQDTAPIQENLDDDYDRMMEERYHVLKSQIHHTVNQIESELTQSLKGNTTREPTPDLTSVPQTSSVPDHFKSQMTASVNPIQPDVQKPKRQMKYTLQKSEQYLSRMNRIPMNSELRFKVDNEKMMMKRKQLEEHRLALEKMKEEEQMNYIEAHNLHRDASLDLA
jgi:hypothetical protein